MNITDDSRVWKFYETVDKLYKNQYHLIKEIKIKFNKDLIKIIYAL